jgi:hypothetical protein
MDRILIVYKNNAYVIKKNRDLNNDDTYKFGVENDYNFSQFQNALERDDMNEVMRLINNLRVENGAQLMEFEENKPKIEENVLDLVNNLKIKNRRLYTERNVLKEEIEKYKNAIEIFERDIQILSSRIAIAENNQLQEVYQEDEEIKLDATLNDMIKEIQKTDVGEIRQLIHELKMMRDYENKIRQMRATINHLKYVNK